MFWKNAKSNYTSRQTDKAPDALPGVRKKSFILPFRSVYKELHADHETGAADNK